MEPKFIPNRLLIVEKIPAGDARWEDIERFALTFDGYKHCGSTERCAEIANSHRHSTLSDLRTRLFFEQRRWRHYGEHPDDDAMRYIRDLISQIRARVSLANALLT